MSVSPSKSQGAPPARSGPLSAGLLWSLFCALALIVAELTWCVPWYRSLTPGLGARPGWQVSLVLGGFTLLAYLLSFVLAQLQILPEIQRVVTIGLFVAGVPLVVNTLVDLQGASLLHALSDLSPGAVFTVAAGLWLCWRGVTLGRESIDPPVVWSSFRLGVAMFVFYYLLISRFAPVETGFVPFLVFLFMELLAMTVARVATIGAFYGSRKNPFDRRWLAITILTISGVLVVAALVSSLATGQLEAIYEVMMWLMLPLIFLASLFAYLIYYVSLLFSQLLIPLVTVQAPSTPAPTPNVAALLETPIPVEAVGGSAPFAFLNLLRTLVFWGLFLALLLVLFRYVRYRFFEPARKDFQDPDATLSGSELLKLLRQSLANRLKEIGDNLLNSTRLRSDPRLLAARIRRIYSQLMELCANLGRPRPGPQTPHEFLPTLQELFPDRVQDLAAITAAYEKVRYGEYPESPAEVEALEAAWKRILTDSQKRGQASPRQAELSAADQASSAGL